jgi:hypothetical protein
MFILRSNKLVEYTNGVPTASYIIEDDAVAQDLVDLLGISLELAQQLLSERDMEDTEGVCCTDTAPTFVGFELGTEFPGDYQFIPPVYAAASFTTVDLSGWQSDGTNLEYTIQLGESSATNIVQEITTTDTYVTFINLIPGTTYFVTIIASNCAGTATGTGRFMTYPVEVTVILVGEGSSPQEGVTEITAIQDFAIDYSSDILVPTPELLAYNVSITVTSVSSPTPTESIDEPNNVVTSYYLGYPTAGTFTLEDVNESITVTIEFCKIEVDWSDFGQSCITV